MCVSSANSVTLGAGERVDSFAIDLLANKFVAVPESESELSGSALARRRGRGLGCTGLSVEVSEAGTPTGIAS